MKKLLVVVAVVFAVKSYAQFGPNLAVDASGVLFKQGSIDVNMLSNLIASKADQVGMKVAQRFILEN